MSAEVKAIPNATRVFSSTYANLPTVGIKAEDLGYATDRKILYRWSGTAWEAISIPTEFANAHDIMFPWEVETVVQGTWACSSIPNQWGTYAFLNSTHNDLDAITISRYFDIGTYTVKIFYEKSIDRGIIKILIDGAEVLSIDSYAGATAYNLLDSTALGAMLVAAAGNKIITLKVNGKNGASSGYLIAVSAIIFLRVT